MNIRAMANAATSRVNPNTPVVLMIPREAAYSDDGSVSIEYDLVPATAQMQPAPSQDLLLIDGRSAGSVYKIFYLNGNLSGLSAPKPADKIIAAGNVYKVVSQPEGWNETAGWTKVLAEQEAPYEPDPEPGPDSEDTGSDNL